MPEMDASVDLSARRPECRERALLVFMMAQAIGEAAGFVRQAATKVAHARLQREALVWLENRADEDQWGTAAFICSELDIDHEALLRTFRSDPEAAVRVLAVRESGGSRVMVDSDASRGIAEAKAELAADRAAAFARAISWDAIVQRDVLAEIRAEARAELGLAASADVDAVDDADAGAVETAPDAESVAVHTDQGDADEALWERTLPRIIQAVANAHQIGANRVVLGDPLKSPATQARLERARKHAMALAVSVGIDTENVAAAFGTDAEAVVEAVAWQWRYPAMLRTCAQIATGLYHFSGVLPREVYERWQLAVAMLASVSGAEHHAAKARASYHRHRETRLATMKAWRETHRDYFRAKQAERMQRPEARARKREFDSRYREANREKIRAYKAEWYARNRERVRAKQRAAKKPEPSGERVAA